LESETSISDFLKKYNISPNDFFILNSDYTDDRFNYSISDLSSKILKGANIKVLFDDSLSNYETNGFILHRIKRKQNLDEISNIYGVDIDLILNYNEEIKIRKNNTIRIPINTKKNQNPIDNFKDYKVKPREGKWRIAYKYGVSVKFLEEINSDMGAVLQIGQIIAVPNKKEIESSFSEKNINYFEILKPIEIYDLEKKLGLKKNSIKNLNPNLSNNLKKGIIIRAPSLAQSYNDIIRVNKKLLTENIVDRGKRKFAIILPFRLENFDYDSIQKSIPIIENDKLLNISLDFLFGAEIAVASFSELGVEIEMDVFDSALDKQKIDNIVLENNIAEYDFVIGPLTNSLFDHFVSLTKNSNTKIIRPLAKKQNTNSSIINTIPNDSIMFNKIISHLKKDTLPSKKYIISDSKTLDISNKIKSIFPESIQFFSTINDAGDDTKTLVYEDLDSTFVKGKNIVFLETKDQGFVSNVTSILNSFVNDTTEIVLVSTNKNNAFEGVNISNKFLSNLKFQYASTNKKIDLVRDQLFIKKFIGTYNSFPNKYSLRAHDLVYDLLLRISNGKLNNKNIYEIETKYFENKFKYKKSSSGSIDNIGVFMMIHEDLEINEIID
tara:strand:+ start:543 stop:2369 length:1827 start_codon:yes stop_codon:yes gene_type:complete